MVLMGLFRALSYMNLATVSRRGAEESNETENETGGTAHRRDRHSGQCRNACRFFARDGEVEDCPRLCFLNGCRFPRGRVVSPGVPG